MTELRKTLLFTLLHEPFANHSNAIESPQLKSKIVGVSARLKGLGYRIQTCSRYRRTSSFPKP